MYGAILLLLTHLNNMAEWWNDIDVDTSEIGSELTRRDRRSFEMTFNEIIMISIKNISSIKFIQSYFFPFWFSSGWPHMVLSRNHSNNVRCIPMRILPSSSNLDHHLVTNDFLGHRNFSQIFIFQKVSG